MASNEVWHEVDITHVRDTGTDCTPRSSNTKIVHADMKKQQLLINRYSTLQHSIWQSDGLNTSRVLITLKAHIEMIWKICLSTIYEFWLI